MAISDTYNCDCMGFMRGMPDKAFGLCIADPPYGIGCDGKIGSDNYGKCGDYTQKDWDSKAPDKEFFNELFRVCQHVIIWGANHFIENLPRQNASCWVVWDKENGESNFADCELAWTSLPCAVRRFRFRWAGMLQGDMSHKESRIHPTQKPVALYAWLLRRFANKGDIIFDPMMGSQSSRIAAFHLGFDFVGCELDKDYYREGCARFDRECMGETVCGGVKVKQLSLGL